LFFLKDIMSLLISCQNLAKSYGHRGLFAGITLGIYDGERVGMFGPNGAGKSTFMKILAGLEEADEGTIERRKGVRVGYVAQEDQFAGATPREELLLTIARAEEHSEEHDRETRAAIILTQMGFGGDHSPDVPVGVLSGGWKKRLSLARELVLEPELLLLDEPTNHLDLEGILWLENLLKGAKFAFLVVTHDRYFLDNVTTRVLEINPIFEGGYLSVPGTYTDFLDRRQPVLEAQEKAQQTMKMKVAEEVAWLKRGPKAQRNKNKSRIKDAAVLFEKYADVRSRTATDQAVDIEFQATERKTKKLLAVHSLVKRMGERLLIDKLNLVFSPGMKVGVLGPNGSGKSTLLKMLSGDLMPDAGTIKRAPDLRVVYFDQQRKQLEREELLKHALAPTSDSVLYNGQLVHVSSYAKRFLFRHEQLDRPVGELSGGEQARVLIAQLMLTAADVLILDEPTNDLDIPSLEVLEQSLEEFPGALVLVTHDRFMLDRLATDIVGLDGQGGHALVTDYEQYRSWTRQRAEAEKREAAQEQAGAQSEVTEKPAAPKKPRKKLTFAEQREYDGMEARIMEAETEVQRWHQAMEDPGVMADRVKLAEVCEKMHQSQEAVAGLYKRWEELEGKLNA
jgi:ATP-binding cassette subfamily F protein uup